MKGITDPSYDIIDESLNDLYQMHTHNKKVFISHLQNYELSNFNNLTVEWLEKSSVQESTNKKISGEIKHYGWRKQINMQARVIGKKADMVLCECLLDPDEKIFETRSFPKLLFENIPNLSEKPFVYISIRMKPGTTRIDIADGSKRIDKTLFEINEKWDEILKYEISKPLTKPLGYDNNNV